jgi:hypothetical protein
MTIPVSDIERMAMAVAKSQLFGIKSNDQALALMLIAQAEGRHPAIAARDYHIVQGRPTLKADAMLARFQEAGGRVEWHCYTGERCEATFSHPAGGSLRMGWTLADAKQAGLTGKPGPWQQFPRAMLRARLISEGIRTVYPGVVCGTYTPEEVADFEPAANPTPMGAAVVVVEPDTASLQAVRDAARGAIERVGRAVVMETMSSLGWEKSEEIPDESRADVIKALEMLHD